MGKRRKFHLVTDKSKADWALKEEGGSRAIKRFTTKEEGVQFSRGYVRKLAPSQLFIHRMDGTIEDENTYGDDPYPPRG